MSPVPWPALPSSVQADSRADSAACLPRPRALFPFEAGGEGGLLQERGVEVSQRPRNVLSS